MNLSKLKKQTCNVKMSLISKNVNVDRICKTEYECYIFQRDIPAKYSLLFSKTPYAVGRLNLDAIN